MVIQPISQPAREFRVYEPGDQLGAEQGDDGHAEARDGKAFIR